MLIIDGNIVRGLGAATHTLALQLPEIGKTFPEIAECSVGTINVVLDAQLDVISPDFVTHPIKWHPKAASEMFGFLSVLFEVPKADITPTKVWIYIPYGSPHRVNPYYTEIIVPEPKLDLQNQVACKIHIPAQRAKVII